MAAGLAGIVVIVVECLVMAGWSRFLILLGVMGIALELEGQLQGEPSWLARLVRFAFAACLLRGLELFALSIKRELREELRKAKSKCEFFEMS